MQPEQLEQLRKLSSLTKVQLLVLASHRELSLRELTLTEALRVGRLHPVSKGSYYRVLQQARTKLRKSVGNILLGAYIGVLDLPTLLKLLDTLTKIQGKTITPELADVIKKIIEKAV